MADDITGEGNQAEGRVETDNLADDLQRLVDEAEGSGDREAVAITPEDVMELDSALGADDQYVSAYVEPPEVAAEALLQCAARKPFGERGGELYCLGDPGHDGDHLFDEPEPEVEEAPAEFVPAIGATVGRDTGGRLFGETPILYRMVFEFSPPIQANKKTLSPATGEMTNEVSRIELFGSSELAFIAAEVAMSRLAAENISRMEAVILDADSRVVWHDRNAGETE